MAASVLDEIRETRHGITLGIAQEMEMADVPQTRRMACAILASALVYHDRIAGLHQDIKPLVQVCGGNVSNPQGKLLTAWDEILGINYWPIFAIAKNILEQMDSETATTILNRLRDTALSVRSTRVENAHDLTGRIFQRLIADRKNLATFYTLPSSALLLARLAVAKLDITDWSSVKNISDLRIGDFACGTGALLSAVYNQISSRHKRAGGNTEGLHRAMMEEVLYGCDVMPSATHMTCSTLSGLEPSVGLRSSEGQKRSIGISGTATVFIRSYSLQHQRPCHTNWQCRGGGGPASACRDTRQLLRSGDHESAIHSQCDA